jgi:hypothetical protein
MQCSLTKFSKALAVEIYDYIAHITLYLLISYSILREYSSENI